jgi:hypothetical protein
MIPDHDDQGKVSSTHDPQVCGLGDDLRHLCPGCLANDQRDQLTKASVSTGLHEELSAIAERFRTAEQKLRRARAFKNAGQHDDAVAEEWEALGDFHAAGEAAADLFLLLLRLALEHRPEAVHLHLADVIRAEVRPVATGVQRTGIAPVRLGGP